MALRIGIMSLETVDVPSGIAYEFAKELALEASVSGTMSGEGNSLGYFTKPQVGHLLYEFADSKDYTDDETLEVWAWVESLPWDGHEIELHFNW